MRIAQLVAQYHAICRSLSYSAIENDPLGCEADSVLRKIAKLPPEDHDDVAALASLARHIIQVEQDPEGAVPLLHNIMHWASKEEDPSYTNVVTFDNVG